jgi:hypothetical protein
MFSDHLYVFYMYYHMYVRGECSGVVGVLVSASFTYHTVNYVLSSIFRVPLC